MNRKKLLRILLIYIINIFCSPFQSLGTEKERVIILVPGTLNSAVPSSIEEVKRISINNPYFSKEIISSLKSNDRDIYVISSLKWLGDLKENGQKVFDELKNWYKQKYSTTKIPITLISHSAGGFYSLWATHLNNQLPIEQQLPIKQIIMIGTPLRGAELANLFFKSPNLFKKIEIALGKAPSLIDFRGLLQLTTQRIEDFLNELILSPKIKMYSIACKQSPPPNVKNIMNSKYLFPPLTITGYFIDKPSDGIVSYESALSTPIKIKSSKNSPGNLPISPVKEISCDINHLEQFLDSQILKLVGVEEVSFVRLKQIELYRKILEIK